MQPILNESVIVIKGNNQIIHKNWKIIRRCSNNASHLPRKITFLKPFSDSRNNDAFIFSKNSFLFCFSSKQIKLKKSVKNLKKKKIEIGKATKPVKSVESAQFLGTCCIDITLLESSGYDFWYNTLNESI